MCTAKGNQVKNIISGQNKRSSYSHHLNLTISLNEQHTEAQLKLNREDSGAKVAIVLTNTKIGY